jgi:hypothetical protein
MHIVMQFFDIVLFSGNNLFVSEMTNRFDLDDESSIPTWASSVLLAGLSAGAFLIALSLPKNNKESSGWWIIGFIAIIFSIDEIAGFHENALQFIHIGLFGWGEQSVSINAWWYLLPLLLTFLIFIGYILAKRLDSKTKRLLLIATIVYFGGSIALEALTSALVINEVSFATTGILVAIEEGAELIGITIALYTTLVKLEDLKVLR